MEFARYFNKNLGETPLECLNRFKAENPEYAGLTATYAGRLDPAAEGEMLFLFGDLVHKKDEYLSHNKTYTAVFALGVSTDTGDLLGLPVKLVKSVPDLDEEKSKKVLENIKHITSQKYPAYSSKPVDGKPLFVHAREGNKVERPSRAIEIFSCDLVETRIISREDLLTRVKKVCDLVKGDFRQKEIVQAWQEIAEKQRLSERFLLVTISLGVSSGTYIRSLTEQFEEIFNIPSVVFELVRNSVENNI